MRKVFDFISLLKAPMKLYFSHYENVPAPYSDIMISHVHPLDRIEIGTKSWVSQDEFFRFFEDLQEQAVACLTEYYYQNIDSQATLEKIYRDISDQLTEITEKYETTSIAEKELYYSTRVVLQVQTATCLCEYSGTEYPFYERLDIEELSKDEHFQIINKLNTIFKAEKKSIESLRAAIKKFNTHNPPETLTKSSETQKKSLYVPESFKIRGASKKNKLTKVRKQLVDDCFIHNSVTADDFKKIFSGEKVAKPIPWLTNKSDLKYFISKILEVKENDTLVVDYPKQNHWKIAAECFVQADGLSKWSSEELRDTKHTQTISTQEKLDEAINKLK